MIKFATATLQNGLKIVVHEDPTTPLAVFNLLYDVGSRDEEPIHTGFAHLFEHLMFAGSANVPDFEQPLYAANGESNAYTSSDFTNFYAQLPAQNIETAFWIESDRMLALNVSNKSLKAQKGVVVEEFKETCLNQPYGDAYHALMAMAYHTHPYAWPVIGRDFTHIEKATLKYVKQFYKKHYLPNHAVLSVVGGVKSEHIFSLAQKWFGDIPTGEAYQHNLPPEPKQTAQRNQTICAEVPAAMLYMAFHMGQRFSKSYYACALLNEILSGGTSSRFYNELVKNNPMFSMVYSSLSYTLDDGLIIIEGQPLPNIPITTAEQAIWAMLDALKEHPVTAAEREKALNKTHGIMAFSEISLTEKAFNLAFYHANNQLELFNTEMDLFEAITINDLQEEAKEVFRKENCSVLHYLPNTVVD